MQKVELSYKGLLKEYISKVNLHAKSTGRDELYVIRFRDEGSHYSLCVDRLGDLEFVPITSTYQYFSELPVDIEYVTEYLAMKVIEDIFSRVLLPYEK